MPKNSIFDYDATAANNADVGGVDISEGCAPSGINDAIRTMMSHIASETANIPITGTVGGTAPDFTLTTGLSLSSLTTGQLFLFTPTASVDNTDNDLMTLNVDSTGAIEVRYAGTQIGFTGGDYRVVSGRPLLVLYDGTRFEIIGPVREKQALVSSYHGSGAAAGLLSGATLDFRTDSGSTSITNRTTFGSTTGEALMKIDGDFSGIGVANAATGTNVAVILEGCDQDRNNTGIEMSGDNTAQIIFKTKDTTVDPKIMVDNTSGSMTLETGSQSGVSNSFILTIGGTTGLTVTNSSIGVNKDVNPFTDNLYDLGSSSKRYNDVYAANGVTTTSDVSAKEDVADADLGLDFIKALRPIRYRYQNGTRSHYGLSAQQVKETLDALGVDFAGYVDPAVNGENGFLGLRYHEFIAPIIQSLKELFDQNAQERAAVQRDREQLRKAHDEINALRDRIAALENPPSA